MVCELTNEPRGIYKQIVTSLSSWLMFLLMSSSSGELWMMAGVRAKSLKSHCSQKDFYFRSPTCWREHDRTQRLSVKCFADRLDQKWNEKGNHTSFCEHGGCSMVWVCQGPSWSWRLAMISGNSEWIKMPAVHMSKPNTDLRAKLWNTNEFRLSQMFSCNIFVVHKGHMWCWK